MGLSILLLRDYLRAATRCEEPPLFKEQPHSAAMQLEPAV